MKIHELISELERLPEMAEVKIVHRIGTPEGDGEFKEVAQVVYHPEEKVFALYSWIR